MGICLFEPLRLTMQSNDLACRQCQMMLAASLAMFTTPALVAEPSRQRPAEVKPTAESGACIAAE